MSIYAEQTTSDNRKQLHRFSVRGMPFVHGHVSCDQYEASYIGHQRGSVGVTKRVLCSRLKDERLMRTPAAGSRDEPSRAGLIVSGFNQS